MQGRRNILGVIGEDEYKCAQVNILVQSSALLVCFGVVNWMAEVLFHDGATFLLLGW